MFPFDNDDGIMIRESEIESLSTNILILFEGLAYVKLTDKYHFNYRGKDKGKCLSIRAVEQLDIASKEHDYRSGKRYHY